MSLVKLSSLPDAEGHGEGGSAASAADSAKEAAVFDADGGVAGANVANMVRRAGSEWEGERRMDARTDEGRGCALFGSQSRDREREASVWMLSACPDVVVLNGYRYLNRQRAERVSGHAFRDSKRRAEDATHGCPLQRLDRG